MTPRPRRARYASSIAWKTLDGFLNRTLTVSIKNSPPSPPRGTRRLRSWTLREAVLYTTELYREPLRYTTSKAKLKPNLSTGFEISISGYV